MYIKHYDIALLLFQALLANAGSFSTLQQCTTSFGKAPVNPVPSAVVALTITSKTVVSVVRTPVSTVTPSHSTVTSSTSVTSTQSLTLPQQTDTLTTTRTKTITSNFIPSTYIFTTYTDTTTITTTLAASTSTLIHIVNGQASILPAVYPTKVLCAVLVIAYATSTSTSTAAKTVTVTAAPLPPASVITTTTTVTTTLVDASTTNTVTTSTYSTTTVVPTTTLSTLSTSTVTEAPPTQTSYAACAANNIQQSLNGQHIDGVYFDSALAQTRTDTPCYCCVACITSYCGAYMFQSYDNGCLQFAAQPQGSCSNPVTRFIAGGSEPIGWYVGDGICGRNAQAPS